MPERIHDIAEDLAAIAHDDPALWRVLWSYYLRHEQQDKKLAELKRDQRLSTALVIAAIACFSSDARHLIEFLAHVKF